MNTLALARPVDETAAAPTRFDAGFRRRAALAAAAVAFAALPLIDRAGLWQWLALLGVAGVAAAAVVIGGRSAAPTAVSNGTVVAPVASRTSDDGLDHLLVELLPVWLQHVESVRTQTDQAITELVTHFSSISDQFEAAGFKAGGAGEISQTHITLLTLCERQLQPVIAVMHNLMAGKDALASSVRELALATRELQDMATAVGRIAAQTNMLAINAAIEAARAGVTAAASP